MLASYGKTKELVHGVNLFISGTAPRNLCVGIDKAGYIFT